MLVEREAQLQTMSGLFEKTAAGQGFVLLVEGEAGVGKSTLVRAATERARDRLAVRRGGCDDLTTAAALGPLLEAVPELAEVAASGVDQHVLLRRLHGVFASGTPTLLVLEDVHWADGATLDALRYLGRRIADVPLLVIATYRPEAVAGRQPLQRLLGELTSATRLKLEPLTPDGVAQLVAASATPSALEPTVLHGDTGGNPFYVTEVLAVGRDEVPATVRVAALARTALLPDGAQHALAAMAVLARAPLAVLTAVAGCEDGDVDECVGNGVLVCEGDECTFRHELARRAVHSTLAPGVRADLHRRCLAVLVTAGADDVGSRIMPRRAATPRVCCIMPGGPASARRGSALIARRPTVSAALTRGAPDIRTPSPASGPLVRVLPHRPTRRRTQARLQVLELVEAAIRRPRATRCDGCRDCRGTSAATPTASATRSAPSTR